MEYQASIKRLMSLIILLFSLFSAHFAAAKGGVDGGGGGLIHRDDRYLTFGSAKIEIKPAPLKQLESIDKLQEIFSQMPLSNYAFSLLSRGLLPFGDRKYYIIPQDKFDLKTRSELMTTYKGLLKGKVPAENLGLGAVTIDKETFLFPEFFKLNEIEKMTLLFHEELWVISKYYSYFDLDYERIVKAEITFQKYLETLNGTYGFDVDLFSNLDKLLNDWTISIIGAAKEDQKAGLLSGFLNKDGLLDLSVIFGGKDFFYISSLYIGGENFSFNNTVDFKNRETRDANLAKLIALNPKMKLFRQIYANIEYVNSDVLFFGSWQNPGNITNPEILPKINSGSIDILESKGQTLPNCFVIYSEQWNEKRFAVPTIKLVQPRHWDQHRKLEID